MSTVNDENIEELNEEHDTCRCHYDEFQLNQNYHECLFHFRFRDVLLRRILNSMEKNGLDKQRLNYLNFAQSLYFFLCCVTANSTKMSIFRSQKQCGTKQ